MSSGRSPSPREYRQVGPHEHSPCRRGLAGGRQTRCRPDDPPIARPMWAEFPARPTSTFVSRTRRVAGRHHERRCWGVGGLPRNVRPVARHGLKTLRFLASRKVQRRTAPDTAVRRRWRHRRTWPPRQEMSTVTLTATRDQPRTSARRMQGASQRRWGGHAPFGRRHPDVVSDQRPAIVPPTGIVPRPSRRPEGNDAPPGGGRSRAPKTLSRPIDGHAARSGSRHLGGRRLSRCATRFIAGARARPAGPRDANTGPNRCRQRDQIAGRATILDRNRPPVDGETTKRPVAARLER